MLHKNDCKSVSYHDFVVNIIYLYKNTVLSICKNDDFVIIMHFFMIVPTALQACFKQKFCLTFFLLYDNIST